MITKLEFVVFSGVLGLSLMGLAFLGGVVADQARFDAAQRWSAPVGREAINVPWTAHLERVEAALAQRNVHAAELAWHGAYAEALRSRRWEGMLEVGEAYLKIGAVAGYRKPAEAKARRAYLTALFRARQQGSVDGVLRAAEAFAALGDREVAEQGVSIAQRLAAQARDAQVSEYVRAVAERLTARLAGSEDSEFGEF